MFFWIFNWLKRQDSVCVSSESAYALDVYRNTILNKASTFCINLCSKRKTLTKSKKTALSSFKSFFFNRNNCILQKVYLDYKK